MKTFVLQNEQNTFEAFLKLLCYEAQLGGVLGREAPQNTSFIILRIHKGSKELQKYFVFCNQTLITHFEPFYFMLRSQDSIFCFFEAILVKTRQKLKFKRFF